MISNKEIDLLACESYERLTNGSKDPNTNLFYRHGFEAGFKKAQEFERFAREMAKTPVKVHVDLDKMRDIPDFCMDYNNPVKDASLRMARAIERKMFKVMLECKSTHVYVVDFGPKYNGSTSEWHAYITCDEEEAKRAVKETGLCYMKHDFKHLVEMTDEEFGRLLMEGRSRGDHNEDIVRKWRYEMKQINRSENETKETT